MICYVYSFLYEANLSTKGSENINDSDLTVITSVVMIPPTRIDLVFSGVVHQTLNMNVT